MLYGQKFTLFMDHKPLVEIFGSKKSIPVCTASRLQHWTTVILGYDCVVKYHSTHNPDQADALARLIDTQHQESEDFVVV